MPRISQAKDFLELVVSCTLAPYTLSTFLLVSHFTAEGTNLCFVVQLNWFFLL